MTKDERREKFLLEHPQFIEKKSTGLLGKICPTCSSVFCPNSSNQKRCGSVVEKLGCAWIYFKERKRTYLIKQRARWQVYSAVLRGIIIKPKRCEKCGKKIRLQGHHPDYSKPLDVKWLCQKDHADVHRTLQMA